MSDRFYWGFLFIICGLLSSCFNQKPISNVQSVKIFCRVQLYNYVDENNSRLIEGVTNIDYFTLGDYVVYKIPSRYENSKVKLDKDMNKVEEAFLDSGKTYKYLVHIKGDSSAILYDSIDASIGRDTLITDFLKRNSMLDPVRSGFAPDENDLLVKSQKTNNLLHETYITKIKKDISYCDTTFISYNNMLKAYPFSFSTKMDSLKNSKMYKIKMIFNPAKYENIIVPRREFLFELRPVDPYNQGDLKALVNRHKECQVKN